MTTPNPTPTEKDLRDAESFVNKFYSPAELEDMDVMAASECLAHYVLDLEAKGIIKFTANRCNHEQP